MSLLVCIPQSLFVAGRLPSERRMSIYAVPVLCRQLCCPHVQGWCRGMVTVIGDAAHAGLPNGQGLNLALEDGALPAVGQRHAAAGMLMDASQLLSVTAQGQCWAGT